MSEVLVEEHDAEELIGRLSALVGELEQHPDAEVREKALDLVQIILKLHGEALRRILATFESLPLKGDIYARMLGDEVIRAILTVHDLLPEELGARVAKAVEELRPFLISQGCDVKLLGVEGGRARLRLMRSGKGAPPVATLKLEIEKVLDVAAPDLLGIDIEGVAEQVEATAKAAAMLGAMIAPPRGEAAATPAKLVQLKRARPDVSNVSGPWVSVVRALGFEDGQLKVVSHAEINLLVCKLDGEFYAYRNACAEGGRALDDAAFEPPILTCACHGHRYDLRRGRSVERPELRLASLPLKIEDDKVKVALPRAV